MATFGYETKGVSNCQFNPDGNIRLCKFQCPSDGVATAITAYLKRAYSCYYYAGIYDTSFNLVAQSDEKAISGAHDDWYTFAGITGLLTGGSYYWLACQSKWSSAVMYYDAGEVSQAAYYHGVYGVFPDPLTPDAYEDRKYSIYCTYTPAGGNPTEIEILRPNAAGDETFIDYQWPLAGEHWDKVDDPADNPDGADTYVEAWGGGWCRDLYNLPAHSEGSGIINSVKVYFRCETMEMDGGYARPALRTHGTTYDGDDALLGWTWVTHSQTWTKNPYTNNDWTWEEIDALEVGISLVVVEGECTYCTQVYVEVDYTPVAAYYHGLKVQGVGELALCDAGVNPLRIRKGGVTYGVELVDVSDPNASKIRIKTGTGIKAIRRYT